MYNSATNPLQKYINIWPSHYLLWECPLFMSHVLALFLTCSHYWSFCNEMNILLRRLRRSERSRRNEGRRTAPRLWIRRGVSITLWKTPRRGAQIMTERFVFIWTNKCMNAHGARHVWMHIKLLNVHKTMVYYRAICFGKLPGIFKLIGNQV